MAKRPTKKKAVPAEPSPVPAFLVACVLIGVGLLKALQDLAVSRNRTVDSKQTQSA